MRLLSLTINALRSRDLKRRFQPLYIASEIELLLISRLAHRFRLS